MSDFFKSILESMHRRASTAILGTYIAFWSVFHWQVFYVSLFVSEDKIFAKYGYLKNEYVNTYFLNPRFDDIYYYLGFILPAILTWLYIWKLPNWLFIRSFKVERQHKVDKELILIGNEKILETKRADLAVKTTATLEAKKEATVAEQELIKLDPTERFDEEYKEFISRPLGKAALQTIKDTVYGHYGYVGNYENPSTGNYNTNDVSPDILALAHTNGLIKFSDENTKIELTKKGLHFLSKLN